MSEKNVLPETGFIRLKSIIGDPKSNPPIPPIIPVCSTVWWDGVKKGIYPKPVKLSANTTAWKVQDIRELIERISSEGVAA